MSRTLPRLLLATGLGLAGTSVAAAGNYSFVTIDAPDPSTLQTVVSGINNAGMISGYYITPTPGPVFFTTYTGFVAAGSGAGFTPVAYPGAYATGLSGLNNAGTSVGVAVDGTTFYGFGIARDAAGMFTTIAPLSLGAVYSEAVGINDTGSIVGYYTTTLPPSIDDIQPYSHGYLFDGTTYTALDFPGTAAGTELYSINNAGVITGSYLDALGLPHGLLYIPGTGFQAFGPPGSYGSTDGINDFGVITGGVLTPDPLSPFGFDSHGYVYAGGVFTPFDVPGAFSTAPAEINDRGQIVGSYLDATGVHGFVATPIPEPASFALLLSLIGGSTMLRRRR